MTVTFEYLQGAREGASSTPRWVPETWNSIRDSFLRTQECWERCLSCPHLRNSTHVWTPPWWLYASSAETLCHWDLGDHGLSAERSLGTSEVKWGRRRWRTWILVAKDLGWSLCSALKLWSFREHVYKLWHWLHYYYHQLLLLKWFG